MENVVVVLNYTSWVSNWIDKLHPYLRNVNLHIIHISKLQKEYCEGLKKYNQYDVSYLSYSELRKLFQTLSPSKCVFFTFRSVLDLTIYKLCIDLKIRKLYLEHGLITNDTLHFRSNAIKTSPIDSIKRQLMHIYKYMGYALKSPSFLKEMSELFQVYIKGKFDLLQFDHYFLLSQRSFVVFKRIFINVEENFTIVGYPIFTDDIQKNNIPIPNNKEGIIYVHQPLIADGVASISYEDEKNFILELSNVLSPKYGKFTLLLHPRSNLDEYKSRFKDSDIKIIQSPGNYKIFIDKKLVIGHYSTALLYGLYFNIPTILIDYPTMKANDLFKSVFQSFESAQDALKAEIHVNKEAKLYVLGKHNTYQYIANYIEQF